MRTEFSRLSYHTVARENLKARDLKEAQFIDDAFLVFAGPTLYLTQKEQQLMKNIKIVLAEDDDLMERSLDAQSDGASRLQSFFAKADVTEDTINFVSKLWVRVILEYDLHRYLEDDWVFNELKSKVPGALFDAAKDPILSALAAAELLRKRDAQDSCTRRIWNSSNWIDSHALAHKYISTCLPHAGKMKNLDTKALVGKLVR